MCVYCNLRLTAMNRHRIRTFGNDTLSVYTATPAAGETVAATFTQDWFGHRVEQTTANAAKEEGAWQFQIAAPDTWETSQQFMYAIGSLVIDNRRWKVKKVEAPVGESHVWKIKAEFQK